MWFVWISPNELYAQNLCPSRIFISDGSMQNETHFVLNCKTHKWIQNDLIGIKSRRGDIVGLLQVTSDIRTDEQVASESASEGWVVAKQLTEQKAAAEGATTREGSVNAENSVGSLAVAETSASSGIAQNEALADESAESKISERVNAESIDQKRFDNLNYKVLKLISVREKRFLQSSDYFEKLDFTINETELEGTSYLWKVKVLPSNTKHRYLPLVTQGETIGDTAQTLWRKEHYLTVFGTLGYGLLDTLSVSTNIPAFALGSPNGKLKSQIFKNNNQTWSVSLSMAQERNSSEKLFNVDLMWDSILTDTLVAHSLISAAVISFDSAKEVAALKSYGSSSIQTGYEYIFSNWSRFLVGPSYNIDQKALGGYLGYVKIINNLHLQTSLTTNNVREFKLSAKEGYFLIVDAYWRW